MTYLVEFVYFPSLPLRYEAAKKPMRDEAVEKCPDERRVAPIRASVG